MPEVNKPLIWSTGVLAATGTVAAAQDFGLDGLYGGLSYGKYDAAENADDYGASSNLAGMYIGYDHDFGSFFVGGEIAGNFGKIAWDHPTEEYEGNVLDAKLRVGTTFSGAKVYGFVGSSRLETNEYAGETFTGPNYGVGASYSVTGNVDVGLEYITRDFGESDESYTDTSALSTVALRVGFSF